MKPDVVIEPVEMTLHQYEAFRQAAAKYGVSVGVWLVTKGANHLAGEWFREHKAKEAAA